MATVAGFLILIALVAGMGAWVRAVRSPGPAIANPTPSRTISNPARNETSEGGDVIGGWLLGHHLAQGHSGFPGDPLPDGHLGAPADLAFWGSVFDDDEYGD